MPAQLSEPEGSVSSEGASSALRGRSAGACPGPGQTERRRGSSARGARTARHTLRGWSAGLWRGAGTRVEWALLSRAGGAAGAVPGVCGCGPCCVTAPRKLWRVGRCPCGPARSCLGRNTQRSAAQLGSCAPSGKDLPCHGASESKVKTSEGVMAHGAAGREVPEPSGRAACLRSCSLQRSQAQ